MVDLLLIDFGNDLHRSRRSHPEQDIGGTGDLADLAVAPQYHAVERSSQQQRVEVHLLRGDPRFCFLEPGPALLVLGARGVVLVAILFGARQITFELASIDFHLIQRAALLGVVLATEDLAGLDHLSLTFAKLDQAAALQRHHFGPALGLDGASSVNGFGNRREVRIAGGHQRWMKQMGIGVIAGPSGGDGQNSGCDEMLQFHGASP